MLRKLLLSIAVVFAATCLAYTQSSGTLMGVIRDKDTKEPIPFANVIIESGGRQIAGATTDMDGKYTIRPVTPGRYDLKTTYVGYKPLQISGVIVRADVITFQDVNLESTAVALEVFEVVDYKVPLISRDQTQAGGTATREEIAKMPGRSAESVAITVGGVFSKDGEMGSVRGAREEGTVFYIDGVRVVGSSSLPKAAIEQVSVITGGLPAQYGDATGGVVNISTRGPSRTFGGGLEFVTSSLFDDYNYNLLGFSMQGPLIKGKADRNTSLMGFFISGEFSHTGASGTSAIGYWKAKDDVIASLENQPMQPSGTGFGVYYRSNFIHKDDLEQVTASMNTPAKRMNLSGKIDIDAIPNVIFSIGGNVNYSDVLYTGNGFSMFNFVNNPQRIDQTYRGFARITHRFPQSKESTSAIKNFYYSLQVDYTKQMITNQDPRHKDNLFNYGYVGKFTTYQERSYELGDVPSLGLSDVWVHNGFRKTLFDFEASDINPVLSGYTGYYYGLYPRMSGFYRTPELVQAGGGLLNGESLPSVYGLYANPGLINNSYFSFDNNQFGASINGSADISNHSLRFGFVFEQRVERFIGYSPRNLWIIGRQLANRHIEQIDLANPIRVYDDNGVPMDTVYFNRLVDLNSQSLFDLNVRKAMGLPVDGQEWIDIDSYDPDFFNISMFSADELLNNGNSLVNYYGYSHDGKLMKNSPSFEAFFNEVDENGRFTRPIDAFRPIYAAGYFQDQFAWKDLIFNIGVRVDRLDLNQKVLKDPFLLYEAKTVSEVDVVGSHPANMGPDYVVYVDNKDNPAFVLGYRNGSTWYNAQGTEVTDPAVIRGPSGIAPYLIDPVAANKGEVKPSAFKDYEPQYTVMPRIAFSFPISDDALFFAHYNVLSKRPTDGARFSLTDYYFLGKLPGDSVLNNPNLKPEKTVDYEVGFNQKLTNSSAIKFSAYYRELRDMVQVVSMTEAYPRSYRTYGNLDFGTVKGTTIAFDLRRTKNVWLKANYTLQFADGTGSDATSAAALIASGQPNLRILYPMDSDRRHNFSTVIDLRWGEGRDYNGPVIKRKPSEDGNPRYFALLQNTGVNFTLTGGSGTPYTKQENPTPAAFGSGVRLIKGGLNSARLPWTFRIDARVDRDFNFKFGGQEGKPKEMNANIYLQVLNIFNFKNVINVYGYTGNPDDDGYLTSNQFQPEINTQLDTQSYIDFYSIAINRAGNYSMPRLIRLGVSFNF